MSNPPARFIRVKADLPPEYVFVYGESLPVGPINSKENGPYDIPNDLAAAAIVAIDHLHMARRLLEMAAGLKPSEFVRLRVDIVPVDPSDDYNPYPLRESVELLQKIKSQNGATLITALWDQLTAANTTGQLVGAGPVSEMNAHAAAFAVALQVANEIITNKRLSIKATDLARIHQLIKKEVGAAANRRAAGGAQSADMAMQGAPPIRIEGKTIFVRDFPVDLNLTSERTEEAVAFIGELLRDPGNWKSSPEIRKATNREGVRFDRVFKDLPESVKSLIESNRRKGYRVRR